MTKCNGLNCKAIDGIGHSVECIMDHNSALHPNAGNNNPEYRYKGYKNEMLGRATEEQQAAWWEGRKASLYPPDNSIHKNKNKIDQLEADNQALRNELEALKKDNKKLQDVWEHTACVNLDLEHGANKIKADAVRGIKQNAPMTNNGFEGFYSYSDIVKYANKLEAGK